jgi:hypothetical protein
MPETKFTPIPGYPGYAVTRDGRVYSTASNWRGYGVRELARTPDDDGYLCVRLTIDKGRRKRVAVHKLVAAIFLPPRPAGHEVRHLNGTKTDNRDDNLAWGHASRQRRRSKRAWADISRPLGHSRKAAKND